MMSCQSSPSSGLETGTVTLEVSLMHAMPSRESTCRTFYWLLVKRVACSQMLLAAFCCALLAFSSACLCCQQNKADSPACHSGTLPPFTEFFALLLLGLDFPILASSMRLHPSFVKLFYFPDHIQRLGPFSSSSCGWPPETNITKCLPLVVLAALKRLLKRSCRTASLSTFLTSLISVSILISSLRVSTSPLPSRQPTKMMVASNPEHSILTPSRCWPSCRRATGASLGQRPHQRHQQLGRVRQRGQSRSERCFRR